MTATAMNPFASDVFWVFHGTSRRCAMSQGISGHSPSGAAPGNL